MRTSLRWIISIFVLMIISFIISGILFLNSGIINLQTGGWNHEGLNEFKNIIENYTDNFKSEFSSMDEYSLNWENSGEDFTNKIVEPAT